MALHSTLHSMLLDNPAVVDLGIFVTSFRAEAARFLRGSGGMLPREILKGRVSEMPFPALCGKI